MKHKRDWEQQIKWGVTAFLVLASISVIATIIMNMGAVRDGIGKLMDILAPIIYGAVMAYLMTPVYNTVRDWIEGQLKTDREKKAKHTWVAKAAGTTAAILMLTCIAVGLVAMIIPEIYKSVINLIDTMPANLTDSYDRLMSLLEDYPDTRRTLEQVYDKLYEFLTNFAQNTLIPNIQNYMSKLGTGIWSAVTFIKNALIGIIVMVYILNMKERLKVFVKRVHYAILPRKTAEAFISEYHYINTVFFGFLSGKLVDSLIIGVLCFIALSAMRMPYTMLVSVLVGVTNIIPFFGPFIGAIPSAILILFVSPVKSLEFLVFILILQQFDGNILGPKILGNSTGVSSFEVLFSILLFGGLFGFVGMIIGVPLWAVLSDLFERWLNWLLGGKKLVLDKNAAVVSDGHAPDANTPDPPAL